MAKKTRSKPWRKMQLRRLHPRLLKVIGLGRSPREGKRNEGGAVHGGAGGGGRTLSQPESCMESFWVLWAREPWLHCELVIRYQELTSDGMESCHFIR